MLSQSQRDVLGLALIALGVFMAVVLYGDSDGGKVGKGLATALGLVIGEARVLAPIALVVGGGALLLDQLIATRRPLRTGGLCIFAAATLALAAGVLGVSSGTPAGALASAQWHSAHLQSHGGILGQGLYWASHRLVQSAGVDILILFLLVVGIVLLTGASLAAVLRATGNGLVDTSRVIRERASALERVTQGVQEERSQRVQAGGSRDASGETMQPPEPAPEELIVRATHVEAPSVDGAPPTLDPWATEEEPAQADAGLDQEDDKHADAEDPEEAEEGAFAAVDLRAASEPDPAGEDTEAEPLDESMLTPQGRLRDVVTDDPDFEWVLPGAERILTRSTAEQARPDTAGQERTATQLDRGLGAFWRAGEGDRHRRRTTHHSL